jgi:beta-lactam-binding protein with PASTA domain
VGTAQYLSPEQARGEQVDARSDLYSTGCLLFELLTGRPPFIGDSPVSVAYQHVREEPSPPSFFESTVSPAVDAITLKALAKRVDERYQSASEMRADIERALGGRPVLAPAVLAAVSQDTQANFLTPVGADAAPTAVTPRGATPYESVPPDRSRTWLWVALTAVAVALAVLAALLVPKLLDTGGTATQVDVPRIIGATVPQAEAQLRRAGLELGKQTPVFSTTVPKNHIVSQRPNPLQRATEGSAVDVTVSAGAQTHVVPDVTPYGIQEATRRLEALKFQVKPVKVKDSQLRLGRVIRTDPAAGTSQRVGTVITVFYSAGFVEVPNVVGQNRVTAMKHLSAAGFEPLPSYQPNDARKGTVVDQSPDGLTQRPYGSTVVIYVSLGPTEPTTPTESTPTTSPPTTTPPTTTPPTTPPTTTPPTTTPPTTTATTPSGGGAGGGAGGHHGH